MTATISQILLALWTIGSIGSVEAARSAGKGANLGMHRSTTPHPTQTVRQPLMSGAGDVRSSAAGVSSSNCPPGRNTNVFELFNGQEPPLYYWESQLLLCLFSGDGEKRYFSEARPAIKSDQPVTVEIELVLLKINEIVERDQEIVSSAFVKISWKDPRLLWNAEEYGGIKWIVTLPQNLWIPDIALVNAADVYQITRDTRFPLTVSHTGEILWVPAGKVRARCELDLRYFPFDEQVCKYRFESWVFESSKVQLNGINFTIDSAHYVENHQWRIRHHLVESRIIHYEQYNFSRVDYIIVLSRKSLFYITYSIFPCLALSTLQVCSHMLPFTESERINFATTTLIAFSVFHVSIVETMPQSSDSIPLLALYVDSLMCLIGLSLVEVFLMMNWIAHVGISVPSPLAWTLFVNGLGRFVFLGSSGSQWCKSYVCVFEKVEIHRALEKAAQLACRQRLGRQSIGTHPSHSRRSSKYRQAVRASLRSHNIDTDEDDLSTAASRRHQHMRLGHAQRYGSSGIPSPLLKAPLATLKAIDDDLVSQSTMPLKPLTGLAARPAYENLRFVERPRPPPVPSTSVPSGLNQGGSGRSRRIFRQIVDDASAAATPPPLEHTPSDESRDLLKDIRQLLDEIEGELSHVGQLARMAEHLELKKECQQVWKTFITVIDRIISLLMLMLCAAVPIFLFFIYPQPVDIAPFLKQGEESDYSTAHHD